MGTLQNMVLIMYLLKPLLLFLTDPPPNFLSRSKIPHLKRNIKCNIMHSDTPRHQMYTGILLTNCVHFMARLGPEYDVQTILNDFDSEAKLSVIVQRGTKKVSPCLKFPPNFCQAQPIELLNPSKSCQ